MCSPLAMYFSFLFFSLAFWPSLSHHPSPVRSWHARHYSPLLTCPRNGQFVVQGTTHDLPGDDPSLAMVRARRGSGAGVPRPGPHEPSFSALQADKLKFHAIESHHLQPPSPCPSHLGHRLAGSPHQSQPAVPCAVLTAVLHTDMHSTDWPAGIRPNLHLPFLTLLSQPAARDTLLAQ